MRAIRKLDMNGGFDIHAAHLIHVKGEALYAHPSGVLFWPKHNVLVLSDLHFEKGSYMTKYDTNLPPYDSHMTLSAMSLAIEAFKPQKVIALGDSFHDIDAPDRMPQNLINKLKELVYNHEWTWIYGNHDPQIPAYLGGQNTSEVTIGALTFRHEPQQGAVGEIAGHLHPCAKVRGKGRAVRRSCFASDGERLIMPAFGAYTGGLNICDEAYSSLFSKEKLYAYMMGTSQIYPIARKTLLTG